MARTKTGSGTEPGGKVDLLFQVLHRDHEEVSGLFQQLLGSPDQDDVIDLWSQLSLSLTAHTRAETETVYQPLARLGDTRELIPHAIEEHNRADKLLAEADALVPGTDEFFALVTSLEEVIRLHVDEEETEILPRAANLLDDRQREHIAQQFQQRKQDILPEVEQELEPVFEEERDEIRAGEQLDDDRADSREIADDSVGPFSSAAAAGGACRSLVFCTAEAPVKSDATGVSFGAVSGATASGRAPAHEAPCETVTDAALKPGPTGSMTIVDCGTWPGGVSGETVVTCVVPV